MSRITCSICGAPAEIREAVDHALRSGEGGRQIAKRCGFSKSTIYRHRDDCLKLSRKHEKARAEALKKTSGCNQQAA